jgi:hypothetical protein
MKKSTLNTLFLSALLLLSVGACAYLNLAASSNVANNPTKKQLKESEKVESDAVFIEVEVLKKLIYQGVSRLPVSRF